MAKRVNLIAALNRHWNDEDATVWKERGLCYWRGIRLVVRRMNDTNLSVDMWTDEEGFVAVMTKRGYEVLVWSDRVEVIGEGTAWPVKVHDGDDGWTQWYPLVTALNEEGY